MSALNHKVRIIIHLIVEHHDWVEGKEVEDEIKKAREQVKEVLKPGRHPGGSKEDNMGRDICQNVHIIELKIRIFQELHMTVLMQR